MCLVGTAQSWATANGCRPDQWHIMHRTKNVHVQAARPTVEMFSHKFGMIGSDPARQVGMIKNWQAIDTGIGCETESTAPNQRYDCCDQHSMAVTIPHQAIKHNHTAQWWERESIADILRCTNWVRVAIPLCPKRPRTVLGMAQARSWATLTTFALCKNNNKYKSK